MAWIDETADEHHLRTWVKHCPAMKLASTLDGKILWANSAFLEWSQYTLTELVRMTWMQLSVPDKNLEYDIDEATRLDSYNPCYTVKKQYIPKGSKPEWGSLTVMRYPMTGDIQCCLCTWEPLKNGTATAFAMAMEHTQKLDQKIEAMTTELRAVTTQTDEDKFILGTIRMIQRHPKLSVAFLVGALSIFGLNNVVELLQRTGLIQLPVKIEKAETHEVDAHQIAVMAVEKSYSTSDGKGLEVSWTKYRGGRTGPVSVTTGRGSVDDGFNINAGDSFTAASVRGGTVQTESSGRNY